MRPVNPCPRSRAAMWVSAALVPVVIVFTGLAMRRHFPRTEYYGQWTADLGMYATA